MKKVIDKILSPQTFAIAYLPWLAVYMVTIVNVMPFTRLVLAAYAIWALAICMKMYFFSGIRAWTHKGMAILLFFLAACLFTQVLQFSYGGFDMIVKLCYFALCLLILYSQYGHDAEDYHRTLRILVVVLGVVIATLLVISDWMYLEMYSATITTRAGVTAKIGFADNRLYGLFSSPNVGGTFALILVWCSVLMLRWSKDMRAKWLLRVMAVAQIAVALMYISVALSRGTYVSGAVLVLSWLLVRTPFGKENMLAWWLQVLIRLTSAAAALAVCVSMMGAIHQASEWLSEWHRERKEAAIEMEPASSAVPAVAGLPMRLSVNFVFTPRAVSSLSSYQDADDASLQQILNGSNLGFDNRVDADNQDISNSRFMIWDIHMSLLEGKHYVVGINYPPAYVKAKQMEGVEFTPMQLYMVNKVNGNLHNGYLQMMINGGLLVLVPMMVFLLWFAIRGLYYFGGALLTRRFAMDSKAYGLFSATLPMVLAILCNNVFETNFVLMGASFIQAFFWLVAGACMQGIREGVKRK